MALCFYPTLELAKEVWDKKSKKLDTQERFKDKNLSNEIQHGDRSIRRITDSGLLNY